MNSIRIPIDVLIYEEIKKQEELQKDKRIELEIEKPFLEKPQPEEKRREQDCIIIQM